MVGHLVNVAEGGEGAGADIPAVGTDQFQQFGPGGAGVGAAEGPGGVVADEPGGVVEGFLDHFDGGRVGQVAEQGARPGADEGGRILQRRLKEGRSEVVYHRRLLQQAGEGFLANQGEGMVQFVDGNFDGDIASRTDISQFLPGFLREIGQGGGEGDYGPDKEQRKNDQRRPGGKFTQEQADRQGQEAAGQEKEDRQAGQADALPTQMG